MARVFEAKEAAVYVPKQGDTLEGLVNGAKEAQAVKMTWQEVALHNWGTIEPREVNRALIEILGCDPKGIDWSNPERTKLDPAFSPDASAAKVKIPRLWKKDGLAVDKTHTIKVRHRKPMPAVAIRKLSPWFLPQKEMCDLQYSLEGISQRADKVGREVLANNYRSATAPKAGADYAESTFTPSDEPIRQELIPDKSKPRKTYDFNTWDGESHAKAGILAPAKGAKAYITAASSPYTVVLRYYKSDAHKTARIRLDSFYPRWKRPTTSGAKPALDVTTLKIKWKVENCTVLKHGQLIIWDTDSNADAPVFLKALGSADLSQGDHEFTWTEGKTVAKLERLPYRVQIQAHTGVDDDDGVAIAAMHTKVAVHSIVLELGDFDKGVFDNANTTNKGHRERLKALGYFHGDIAEDATNPDFKKAVEWFQSEHDSTAPTKGVVGPTTQKNLIERLQHIVEGGSLSNSVKKRIFISGAFFITAEADLNADEKHHRFKAETDFWGRLGIAHRASDTRVRTDLSEEQGRRQGRGAGVCRRAQGAARVGGHDGESLDAHRQAEGLCREGEQLLQGHDDAERTGVSQGPRREAGRHDPEDIPGNEGHDQVPFLGGQGSGFRPWMGGHFHGAERKRHESRVCGCGLRSRPFRR